MIFAKKLSALLLCAILMLSLGVTAHAYDTLDTSRTGAISVSMVCGGKAVPGGALTLYRVGEILETDGSYRFVLTDDFAESGADLSDASSTELPEKLSTYAAQKKLSGRTVEIADNGKAAAGDLDLGLYLVVQSKAANGYQPVAPFLVSVPMYEEGAFVYDVDATPKMRALTAATPSPTPAASPKPSTPTGPTLPQTGQLNWPVPVMAVLGLCLFLAGWALRYGKKERPDEA